MAFGIAGRLLGALLVLSCGLGAEAVAALPAPAIIIVDLAQVLRDAKAAKDIQQQLEKETAGYSRQISQEENELQRLREELERQRTALAADVYRTKTREFQQRYDELDRTVQARRQVLQQSFNDAMAKVENAALQTIADVAKERGANLVLTKAAAIFAADGLDVTADVVSRLDAKLPKVAVSLPVGGDSGGTTPPKN